METQTPHTQQDGTVQIMYKTHGTCSQYIQVAARQGIVTHCHIYGGCDGNTRGLSQLVEGMPVRDVIARLDGIRCGTKGTSCPDQLCRALEQLGQTGD